MTVMTVMTVMTGSTVTDRVETWPRAFPLTVDVAWPTVMTAAAGLATNYVFSPFPAEAPLGDDGGDGGDGGATVRPHLNSLS